MNIQAVKENLREWLKNPSWAEYYNGAPSDRCREFIALEFYYSEYEDGETAEEKDRIEEELGMTISATSWPGAAITPGKASWHGRSGRWRRRNDMSPGGRPGRQLICIY